MYSTTKKMNSAVERAGLWELDVDFFVCLLDLKNNIMTSKPFVYMFTFIYKSVFEYFLYACM